MNTIFETLIKEAEPCVRYRWLTGVEQIDPAAPELQPLREEIRNSPRVQTMLAPRNTDGQFPWHAYQKWKGAFWTLLVLADLGYPTGDEALLPLAEQDFEWLLDPKRLKSIPTINGRTRRCCCQEGGVVFSLLKLGFGDARIERLAGMLLKWQWPDGGWNCDKHPEASHSSFHESFIPLRALNLWWQASGDPKVKATIDLACELFLSHSLYKRSSNQQIIKPVFTQLAYPAFWHYDILWGLRAMAETGHLLDPRCADALDLLESKRLPDGGFAAETKYYQVSTEIKTGTSFVDWGGTGSTRSNPFITAEALSLLKLAGRK
jgi:hypothetical protein